MDEPEQPVAAPPVTPPRRTARTHPAAVALVVSLAALTADAIDGAVVRDIQRYCTACWRNARLDPCLWDDCTQEVCCRLLDKARNGSLDLSQVLAEDSPERRELIRAIDMVRKRVQRGRRLATLDESYSPDRPGPDHQIELAELLESARRAVLTDRQDRIVEMWTHGWTVPEIATELKIAPARVSDEKYKALRKLEKHLSERHEAVA